MGIRTALRALALVVSSLVAFRIVVRPRLWKPPTEPDANQDECMGGSQLSATDYSPSGVVRIIRLTDDGEFANRCQLTDAIYEIRNYRGPELIVWYIHGWKHNADENDSDLRQFRKLIGELAEQQCHLKEESRRRVVGIYVGWDGAVGPRYLQNLTFWNRKWAADRISQSAVLTKIIAATKSAREQVGKEITAKDLTIMIGHSFGARILYTATSQILLAEVQRRHPGYMYGTYRVIKGPADLILLLNPAFEASMFTAMHSIRRPDANWWEQIDSQQQPRLLVLASKNDWATGMLFPWGQSWEFARRDRQRMTLGNYKRYITHSLQRVKSSDDSSANSPFWYDHFQAAGLLLQRTAERQPGNPFLVAQTTPDIIDGHNGIWGNDLREWIVGFLRELQQRASVSQKASGYASDAC